MMRVGIQEVKTEKSEDRNKKKIRRKIIKNFMPHIILMIILLCFCNGCSQNEDKIDTDDNVVLVKKKFIQYRIKMLVILKRY